MAKKSDTAQLRTPELGADETARGIRKLQRRLDEIKERIASPPPYDGAAVENVERAIQNDVH